MGAGVDDMLIEMIESNNQVKSKVLTPLLIFLMAVNLFAWSFGGGGSNTLVVDNNPSYFFFFSISCENTTNPYSTVQDALDAAQDGDTIEICPGTYEEQYLKITKNDLTIEGVKGNNTDINITNDSYSDKRNIFSIKANINNLTIKNLTLTQTRVDSRRSAIYSSSSYDISNIVFEDLNIDSKSRGIYIEGNFENSSIINSVINANKEAIYLTSVYDDINISDNNITKSTYGIMLKNLNSDGSEHNIKNNIIQNSSEKALYIESDKHIGYQVINNCFEKSSGDNAVSEDEDGYFDKNYYNDWSGSGSYEIPTIPKYDNNPQNSCSLSSMPKPIINYRMDECSWDNNDKTYEIKNSGTLGEDYNATAGNDANVTEGKIYNGGDINSTATEDKYIFSEKSIYLPTDYTISFWAKFPLNFDGHKKFDGKYYYFNIADKPGSNSDFIYFKYNTDYKSWQVCLEGDNYECKDYDIGNLDGWKMVTFEINGDDEESYFYINKTKELTFDQAPSGELGLIFNSDYDSTKTNKPNEQSIGATVDEFKIFDKILTQEDIENIYNNENSGENYDGTQRVAPICGNNDDNTTKNYKFDAWDTFRSINDRNISTKIVGKEFNLTIASLDENGTALQDFNGTVCATVENNTSRLIFKDQNTSTVSYTINNATRNTIVNISWKKNAYETCPLTIEDNSTVSSDNFAIRPEKFAIDINTTSLYAGEPFTMDINATDFDGTNTKDYNETNGTSFVFDINSSNSNCKKGVLGDLPSPLKFSDGVISADVNYSEVGDVNLTISEVDDCKDKFAAVDCDDKNVTGKWNTDTDLSISPAYKNIVFAPYQFAIEEYKFERNPNQSWIYMADVKDTNISISFRVQAQNKMGQITKNFDKSCYSKNVGINIDLNSTMGDENVSYYQVVNNTIKNAHDKNLTTLDMNATIESQDFSEGNSSKILYALNVYRVYNKEENPVDINVSDINTTYPNDANVTNIGLAIDDNNTVFYYGRIRAKDIDTNQHTVENNLYIEIYSTYNLSGFIENSLDWYAMKDDNITKVIDFIPKETFDMSSQDKQGIDDINSTQSTSNGYVYFTIKNHWDKSDSAYIHLKIPKYLWYNLYKDYNDSNESDCSSHPCLRYSYTSSVNIGIKSGSFKGTDINTSDYNASIVKKGVKVYR